MRLLPIKYKGLAISIAPFLFATIVSAQISPSPPPPPNPTPQPPPVGSACPATQKAPYELNGLCVVETTYYEADPNDAIPGNRKCTEWMRRDNPVGSPEHPCRDMSIGNIKFHSGSITCKYTKVGPLYYDRGLSCPSGYALNQDAGSLQCPESDPVRTDVTESIGVGGRTHTECSHNRSRKLLECRSTSEEILRDLNIPTGVCQRCNVSTVTTVVVDSSLCAGTDGQAQ